MHLVVIVQLIYKEEFNYLLTKPVLHYIVKEKSLLQMQRLQQMIDLNFMAGIFLFQIVQFPSK